MDAQSQVANGFYLPSAKTRALALLALFAILQIADAWLTAAGIDRFGMAAEANPLLALPIALFGAATALAIAKGAAIGAAVVLHRLSRHGLLAALTVMYMFVAVMPWAMALAVA
jgi:uncharacterized protein DUF5658